MKNVGCIEDQLAHTNSSSTNKRKLNSIEIEMREIYVGDMTCVGKEIKDAEIFSFFLMIS